MHLKFLSGNFIIGSSLLCFNGTVDKSLCGDDNSVSPFSVPVAIITHVFVYSHCLRSRGSIKEMAVTASVSQIQPEFNQLPYSLCLGGCWK